MKNYDLLKIVASKLNGLPYGLEDRTIKELDAYYKEKGIVICFGQSDDLMELRGAIDDEYGCWDGGTICIDEKGNDDADANVYFPITAVWAKENISWQYEFEPKHEVFNIYEDGEIYCRGIVFFVDDLKRNIESECKICVLENARYTRLPLGDDANESERYCGIYAQKYPDGRLYIYGECCDESIHYYPKYCPECGRKLHD